MKTWLVTGATGFVGANLVRVLLGRGDHVRAVIRKPNRCTEGLAIETVKADLADVPALTEHARGTAGILHVAGTFDPSPGGEALMRAIHVDAASALSTAASTADVPFLYCSSSITIGYGTRDHPADEDAPLDANALYGTTGPLRTYFETKLAGERITATTGGYIVNPDYVLGPWDVKPTSGQIVLSMLKHPVPVAPSGGKCFVDAEDCAWGHILAVERGHPGRRYLLGNHNRSYAEFLAEVAAVVGRRPPLIRVPGWGLRAVGVIGRQLARVDAHRFAGLDPKLLLAMQEGRYRSGARAQTELGLPVTPLERTIRSTVTWFREQGYVG